MFMPNLERFYFPKKDSGQDAYTFMIPILSTSFTSVSNFLSDAALGIYLYVCSCVPHAQNIYIYRVHSSVWHLLYY
jgi:hypothetical protein